ncbi:MAG TPA: threonine/serine dehydratase [Chloroflexota bacterium]|nr:threonine/serine dehydratase [Chloroflexota bacterium]
MADQELTLQKIQETRRQLAPYIVETPIWQWRNQTITRVIGEDISLFLKLELFQHTGSFKPRGALCNMLALNAAELQRGVTAVSAGNHAIAVAYAAQILATTAKVVMPAHANPARVETCRAYGAEVELVANVHEAFTRARQIETDEGRLFIHPFEGERTALGTATVGWELCHQVPDLQAVIVPIGGGGLCAGVATAVKQMQPHCRVYGVEPEGAASMSRSRASGKPEAIEAVTTIADSLGAPHAAPYSFALCQKYVDDVVLVDDAAMMRAMRLMYEGVKLAVEPAGAAALAALCGPLRARVAGQRVAVIVSGTNIDPASFARLLGVTAV